MSDETLRVVVEGAGPILNVNTSSMVSESDSAYRVGLSITTHITTLAESAEAQQLTDLADRPVSNVPLTPGVTSFASPHARGIIGTLLSAQRNINGSPFLRRAVTPEAANAELDLDVQQEPSSQPVQREPMAAILPEAGAPLQQITHAGLSCDELLGLLAIFLESPFAGRRAVKTSLLSSGLPQAHTTFGGGGGECTRG